MGKSKPIMQSNGVEMKSEKGFAAFCTKFRKQIGLQMMVLPCILWFAVFCYWPIYGLNIAFRSYTVTSNLKTAEWVGLKNFQTILTDQYFWQSVYNTLGISFMKLLIGFPAPILLAIMIYELKGGKFKKIVQTISYLPHFLSWIVLGGMLILWLSSNGMLSQMFMALGVMEEGKNFLLDADKYWWIAVLSDVWKEVGWGTILYLATMTGIDPTYYEAAKIDGAGRLRQIWSITLPLCKNIICLNLILTISGLLGSNLDQTMILLNTQNQPKAEVINYYVYRVGMSQGDFSYGTAVGLGVSVVSVILLVLANMVTAKINETSVL